MQLLEKFKRKFRNFGVEDLMLYAVITIGVVWAVEYILRIDLSSYLMFVRDDILKGQIWRVVSFMFVPQSGGPISTFFWLILYYSIGTNLERYWGKAAFNLYYIIGTVLLAVGGFFSGIVIAHYFYMSLFIAYAILNPNDRLLMLAIIPIKVKYLAFIDVLYMIYDFIVYPIAPIRVSIIMPVILLFIFFGGDIINSIKAKKRYNDFKKNFNDRNN